jgi:hypothetical protein
VPGGAAGPFTFARCTYLYTYVRAYPAPTRTRGDRGAGRASRGAPYVRSGRTGRRGRAGRVPERCAPYDVAAPRLTRVTSTCSIPLVGCRVRSWIHSLELPARGWAGRQRVRALTLPAGTLFFYFSRLFTGAVHSEKRWKYKPTWLNVRRAWPGETSFSMEKGTRHGRVGTNMHAAGGQLHYQFLHQWMCRDHTRIQIRGQWTDYICSIHCPLLVSNSNSTW